MLDDLSKEVLDKIWEDTLKTYNEKNRKRKNMSEVTESYEEKEHHKLRWGEDYPSDTAIARGWRRATDRGFFLGEPTDAERVLDLYGRKHPVTIQTFQYAWALLDGDRVEFSGADHLIIEESTL
jgi:hypothetical protein